MIVWRICKSARASAAFDGEGARRYPGRWNERGVAVAYCAGTLSLACLEYFVHLDPDDLPDDLVSIRVEIPRGVRVETVEETTLPPHWRRTPGPAELRAIGSHWVAAATSVALRVPSAIIPQESNVLLNPAHPDLAKLQLGPPQPLAFDPRLRKS